MKNTLIFPGEENALRHSSFAPILIGYDLFPMSMARARSVVLAKA